jgi:UDP-N-acetylmuramoylalanine--D-glutamate ligase
MIVVFGKGKVWNGLNKLLNKLEIENVIMDDQDWNDDILSKSDKIICSPGIKQDHNLYLKYSDKVFSELNFLWEIIKELWLEEYLEIIGVTWTNGKSTSVHIMYNLFKWIFEKLNIKTNVYLSWNFWTPLSETLCEIIDAWKDQKHLIVLEVSSFMLYKLNNFGFDYGILTNLWVDHLDWHKDIDEYFDSKFKLIDYTKKYAVTDKSSLELYKKRQWRNDNKIYEHMRIEKYQKHFDLEKTNFLWEYNKWNWNAIYKVIWEYFDDNRLDLDDEIFLEIAKNIEPLDHRMKMVKKIDEIKIYDDGICTSSQALAAALSCFDEKIILIAGGYDKWEDYIWLENEFEKKIWFACLIWQTAEKFKAICEDKKIKYKIFKTLKEALNYSVQEAKKLKTKNILFSPGSASFDMFKNVYDRCEQFTKIVDIL